MQDVVVMGVGVRVSTAGCVAVGDVVVIGVGAAVRVSVADQRSRYSVGTWDENWCPSRHGKSCCSGDMVLSQHCQCNIRACESRRIRENRDTEAGCVRWRIALPGWGCGCGSVARL